MVRRGSDTVLRAGTAQRGDAHRRRRRRCTGMRGGCRATHLYDLSCMPVRTSHACTGPSALLPVSTTSSRKLATAVMVRARRVSVEPAVTLSYSTEFTHNL